MYSSEHEESGRHFTLSISGIGKGISSFIYVRINILFLAHLSRRLIGELIVYKGIRRPSVVRLSTFSNDISSEAVRPILLIFHI